MALFYRRDDDVQNGLGEAVPNIAVTYYSQPSLTPATIYYDPAGTMPAPNPQYTNGLGQTAAYMAAGLYTITYVGEQIQTLTYPDQLVGPGTGGGSNCKRAGACGRGHARSPVWTTDGRYCMGSFPVPDRRAGGDRRGGCV